MPLFRVTSVAAIALVLTLIGAACTPAQPSPTAAPTTAPSVSTTTPAATPAATVATPAAATPTAATKAATASAPATVPASGSVSAGDLNAKAGAAKEYSFSYRISGAGQSVIIAAYVKGNKMRYEQSAIGMSSIILMDADKKEAYGLIPGQNTAIRIDFSQAVDQTELPSAGLSGIPNDARSIATETLDGKQAAVFQIDSPQGPIKYWVWVDRGLLLKAEATTPQGTITLEYTDYRFGPLDDNLFQLPAGTKIVDMPGGLPGATPKP